MPKRAIPPTDITEETKEQIPTIQKNDDEVSNLNRMLAAVLNYISDDEVEVIDIEHILNHTEGLRDWWDQYRETNRKQIEEEIKQSLAELPLEELESIREKIKEKRS
jgi:hypothetical protein